MKTILIRGHRRADGRIEVQIWNDQTQNFIGEMNVTEEQWRIFKEEARRKKPYYRFEDDFGPMANENVGFAEDVTYVLSGAQQEVDTSEGTDETALPEEKP